jgi:hypothetical protein
VSSLEVGPSFLRKEGLFFENSRSCRYKYVERGRRQLASSAYPKERVMSKYTGGTFCNNEVELFGLFSTQILPKISGIVPDLQNVKVTMDFDDEDQSLKIELDKVVTKDQIEKMIVALEVDGMKFDYDPDEATTLWVVTWWVNIPGL